MAMIEAASTCAGSHFPLAYKVFRAVWIANLASNFGVLIQSVGASWLMVSSGASRQMIALVQTSTTLPIVMLSLLSGAIADNMNRRSVLLSAQIFLMLVSGVLAALAYVGLVTPWRLIVMTFLVGCGTALNGPAWQASVGEMVPRAALPNAVAYNSMGLNIARTVGPALGGLIVAAFGPAITFLINALSSVGLIVVLARWRPVPAPEPAGSEPLGAAMLAGLHYAAKSPQIRTVMLRSCLSGVSAGAIMALMPLMARDLLGGGPKVFGLLFGSFGVGAVAGGLGSVRLRRALTSENLLRCATLMLALATFGTACSRVAFVTAPCLALAGACWVLTFSTLNVSVQFASARWMVARTLSLYQTGVYAGLASGSWLIGHLAERMGTSFALLAAAGFGLCTLGVALVRPLAPSSSLGPEPAIG